MAPLPDARRAVVEPRKLAGYCLDPAHPRGRHKARLFRAALGLGRGDAVWLCQAILAALPTAEAVMQATDAFGTRYRVDLALRRDGRRALVRTVWLVPPAGLPPRLVTCYVL